MSLVMDEDLESVYDAKAVQQDMMMTMNEEIVAQVKRYGLVRQMHDIQMPTQRVHKKDKIGSPA